jgi:N-acetylmuramoyl-L-alanine amidase
MRPIDLVVIHCSDSLYGDATLIDVWHKQRGWAEIGYHYVILNGYPDEASHRLKRPQFARDGELQTGRPLTEVGAHVRGRNENSVGICLIGCDQFTSAQFATLAKLLADLRSQFPEAKVVGHYEVQLAEDPPKSCPNLDMDWMRGLLKA